METFQQTRPVVIDEQTKIPMSLVIPLICGGFAMVMVIIGAVFWGGLLQARAEAQADRISKLEISQERYSQDQVLVQQKLIELKVLLEQMPKRR